MGRSYLSPLFLVVLAALWFVSVSGQICIDSAGTFKLNSTYDINRRIILSSLASNVTAQDGLFYNSSVGQEPNKVFAMALCIHGSHTKDCSVCIDEGITELIQFCPNKTEAYTWWGDDTLCMVRYGNRSFLGSMLLEPFIIRNNPGIITSNVSEFHRILDDLMVRMINSASSGRNGASSSSSKFHAVEVTELTALHRIYALMECTPDISPGNCDACLRANVESFQDCCRSNIGGATRRPSCYVRWDLYPFVGAFDNITLGSPPPQPLTLGAPPPQPLTSNGDKKAGDGEGKAKKASLSLPTGAILGIVGGTVGIIILLLALGFAFYRRRKSSRENDIQSSDEDISTQHCLQFDFKTIEVATSKFSKSDMLGQGGFGEVYKGILPKGTEVAVKRLSKTSGQGAKEFKTEAVLVAKLQHRNLVRLLGYCLEGEEKILVYEFVPNMSLDYVLFDPKKQGQLDWTTRYKIVTGTARGILYLHQDSRLTIIHRDLKASNILLDADMNPKIADFGMARIIEIDQTLDNTNRIAGTYGYMSPEYAMHGLYSTKSDVYSFGVLVLEIITGKRNSSFHQSDDNSINLVSYAWSFWRNESTLELVDPAIVESCDNSEVTRCIHIALLCVQENSSDRPSLSTIILMLTSNTINLPLPNQPGFFFGSTSGQGLAAKGFESGLIPFSINDTTMSGIDPC